MSDTKILLTGATGFIAGHCVEELLGNGYAVRGTVRSLQDADLVPLQAIAERTGGSLEFVEASLDDDAGWAAAAEGCDHVWHVASPNPPAVPKDENELIGPAVDGTLRVLEAATASSTVRRVIMTSSSDAITAGHDGADDHVFTEADWSDLDRAAPYAKSKTLAEQAAWRFVEDKPLELVTLQPGLVLGPLLREQRTTSVEVVRKLMAREVPAVPKIGFALVDVRDIAFAHRLAMETPAAAGNRYICAGESMWMGEIAAVLAAELRPRDYKISTRPLPCPLMWLLARFDRSIRLALTYVGKRPALSAEKARRELGWSSRPARQSILDTAESLLQFGVVPRSAADQGAAIVAEERLRR
jgi:dihydroflavonol-4-reductase